MDRTEAAKEFQRGMTFYRNQYPGKALPHVRQAAELEKNNPTYVSYLGLIVGLAQKKWGEAEKLCQGALRMRRHDPQLYLNLAEVYLKARRKEDAVYILTTGLQYTKQDVRLRRALRRLGVRRAPVFSFLGRGHPLNRHVGKLRHRLLELVGAE